MTLSKYTTGKGKIKVENFMTVLTESSIILTAFLIDRFFYRKNLPSPSNIKKILIVKLDHIGDLLLVTPVITNLRRHYPHAHIAMLVGSWSKQVIECNPHIDEILSYDSPFFRRAGRSATLKDAMQMLRRLKCERYDLIVELRGDFLTLALAMLRGGKYRLDLSTQRVLKKLRNSLLVNWGKEELKVESEYSKHEVEINLDVLRSGNITITSRKTFFNVPPESQTWSKGFLSELGMGESKPIIAIHPGSPVPLKRWLPERFAKLADILIERKMQVLFIGGPNERQLVGEIQSQMRHKPANIAGRTNLQQLGAVLHNCHLFIGNDSGPMHLAAAVGARVIGLFGPSSPERFGPFGDNCTAIRRKSDCSPCMKEKCRVVEEGCIIEISVEDVLGVIKEMFSGRIDER
jgi:predicted lipopolysaccharide heptosyltransferase III